jgi:hypothetical protein
MHCIVSHVQLYDLSVVRPHMCGTTCNKCIVLSARMVVHAVVQSTCVVWTVRFTREVCFPVVQSTHVVRPVVQTV